MDCHINNLYNTTFWALVQLGNVSNEEAHKRLMKTFSKDKNEILFTQFNINYNFLPEIYKKGTTIYRCNFNFDEISETLKNKKQNKDKKNKKKNKTIENSEQYICSKDYKIDNQIEDKLSKEFDNKAKIEIEQNKIDLLEKKNHNNNDDRQNNNLYEFSFSENFMEIYSRIKEKNIELTNEDIIKDDFWLRNNFVFKNKEDNI